MQSAVSFAPLWHDGGSGGTVLIAGALGSGHRAVSRPWPASQSSYDAMPFPSDEYNIHPHTARGKNRLGQPYPFGNFQFNPCDCSYSQIIHHYCKVYVLSF
uniref:Predicted protein n=1 Tax=Hordeum vulgare subsp. vulgare TaxID=112509 RepID=F2EKK1_HORVV|nr:predicted protein [Hordeum vulgare subsp. vulgare]